MYLLRERILEEGRALGGGILKVDGLINHRVDAAVMRHCGDAFAEHFKDTRPDLILTAEISGIAPALMTAAALGCNVVYARKKRPVTMPEEPYVAHAPSHTKGGVTPLIVSREFLKGGERVLIIDDFLASGQTIQALATLCDLAGAELVGIGALVEKSFEGGRALLSERAVPVYSIVQITRLAEGVIELAPGEGHS
jgi:xanthine phosphoribosyltransferase